MIVPGHPNLRMFAKAVHEFPVYIRSNTGRLINYGERFRAGERILRGGKQEGMISTRFVALHASRRAWQDRR